MYGMINPQKLTVQPFNFEFFTNKIEIKLTIVSVNIHVSHLLWVYFEHIYL